MTFLISQIIFVISICYLLCAGIFLFDTPIDQPANVDKIHEILSNGYYYFGAIISLALSAVSIGGVIKKAEKARHLQVMQDELDAQKQRLIDYIKLAKIITKEDAKIIIENYISKIDKKHLTQWKNQLTPTNTKKG